MTDYIVAYRQKIEAGKLCLQFCQSCGKFIFYPRSMCPHCLQSDLEWQEVSGQGYVHSYTIVNVSALPAFKEETPYIYALIELAEGIRMPSSLIGCPVNEVRIGLPVEVTFIERDGRHIPVFKPDKPVFPAVLPPFESTYGEPADLKHRGENQS